MEVNSGWWYLLSHGCTYLWYLFCSLNGVFFQKVLQSILFVEKFSFILCKIHLICTPWMTAVGSWWNGNGQLSIAQPLYSMWMPETWPSGFQSLTRKYAKNNNSLSQLTSLGLISILDSPVLLNNSELLWNSFPAIHEESKLSPKESILILYKELPNK